MKLYLLCSLLACFQKSIFSDQFCGEKTDVIGVEGGAAILQVNKTIAIRDIAWFIGQKVFASTYLNEIMNVQDVSLKHRLQSTTDGSLTFNPLMKEDQKMYKAYVRTMEKEICTQDYNLKVYRRLSDADIQIHYSINRSETCGVTMTCTGNGSDMTLSWSNTQTGHREVKGHTLHVYDVHIDVSYSCTAENPVSRATRRVTPWLYCEEDKLSSYRLQNVIRLILSACIFIIALCLIFCHVNGCQTIK